MRRMPWATYLWPGLPQLWTDGAWSGLALAVGFSILLNGLLLATLVWTELMSWPLTALGCLAAAGVWCAAIVITVRRQPAAEAVVREAASVEDLFCSALSEYLKGHWFEAEAQLGRLFEQRPRDLEARLLLATLLRHTKRYSEAREQLVRIQRIEGATKWSEEIAAEKQLLAEATREPLAWQRNSTDTRGIETAETGTNETVTTETVEPTIAKAA